jgi:hypothetical protein
MTMPFEPLAAPAIEFVGAELIPTLVALATAALREPLSWGVIGGVALARVWCLTRGTR